MSDIRRLDLGCGMNKREGFTGVDSIAFSGVDVVCDLTKSPWPWEDNSIDEAHSSHFVEHLEAQQRILFVNELYRVLKPGGKASIIVPHWASCRAYGDMTHRWPPVSEFWFYYLSKEWRLGNKEKGINANAPHDDITWNPNGYSCDFDAVWGNSMHPYLATRNQDFQNFAMQWYKEAIQDLYATLTKR